MNYESAWSSLQQQVPHEFFENPLEMPLGDKVAAMIFIGCGLGIAYLFELQREGYQIISFKEMSNVMNELSYNPMHGLHQTSLNLQSILMEGSKSIREQSE